MIVMKVNIAAKRSRVYSRLIGGKTEYGEKSGWADVIVRACLEGVNWTMIA